MKMCDVVIFVLVVILFVPDEVILFLMLSYFLYDFIFLPVVEIFITVVVIRISDLVIFVLVVIMFFPDVIIFILDSEP